LQIVWPLLILGLLFAFLGVACLKAPEDAKAFFARNISSFLGDRAGSSYRRLPDSLFQLMGVIFLVGGLAMSAAAILGF
jgi:hypothetical protein